MTYPDGTLITGALSHEIFVIESGKRRWVPDSWTMCEKGLSPSNLQIVRDDELEKIEEAGPLPSAMPSPQLTEGTVVESEHGVYRMHDGQLEPVLEPRSLASEGDARLEEVVFLPESLIRQLLPADLTEGIERAINLG